MGNAVGDQKEKDSEDIQKQKILESRNGYVHGKDRFDGEVSLDEAETADKNTDSKLIMHKSATFHLCTKLIIKKYIRCQE